MFNYLAVFLNKKAMGPQKTNKREVILADMHDDGVHFNPALLAKQKKMRQENAPRKVKKNKAK